MTLLLIYQRRLSLSSVVTERDLFRELSSSEACRQVFQASRPVNSASQLNQSQNLFCHSTADSSQAPYIINAVIKPWRSFLTFLAPFLLYQSCYSADVVFIACVAGVRKGRGRELGQATVFRASLFRSNFSANKTTPPCRSLVSVSPSRIKKTGNRIPNSIYRRQAKLFKNLVTEALGCWITTCRLLFFLQLSLIINKKLYQRFVRQFKSPQGYS